MDDFTIKDYRDVKEFQELSKLDNFQDEIEEPDQQKLFDSLLGENQNQAAISYLNKRRNDTKRISNTQIYVKDVGRKSVDIDDDYFEKQIAFESTPKAQLNTKKMVDLTTKVIQPNMQAKTVIEITKKNEENKINLIPEEKSFEEDKNEDSMMNSSVNHDDRFDQNLEDELEKGEHFNFNQYQLSERSNSDILSQDDSFTNYEIEMSEYKEKLPEGSPASGIALRKIADPAKKEQLPKERQDTMKLIDQNERRYQEYSKQKLEASSVISLSNFQHDDTQKRVLSKPKELLKVGGKMKREQQFNGSVTTCIGLSEDLLFYGNSDGTVKMFDKENEQEYSVFSDKNKEFIGNPVTAIDIHPTRQDYVILGFQRGQLVLFDVTDPKKPIKSIKDHHKGHQIVNVKFCDWRGKGTADQQNESFNSQQLNQSMSSTANDDKQHWMFISVDEQGKVLVNTISKVVFIMNSSKHVLIDPKKVDIPKFIQISCSSQIYPQGEENDKACLVALGNSEDVLILQINQNKDTILKDIKRPKSYYSRKEQRYIEFKPIHPQICWGYGHSPIFKDRSYSLLAITWGPLIQVIVLNDVADKSNPLFYDGYYLLREEMPITLKIKTQDNNEENEQDDEDLYKNEVEHSFNNYNLYIDQMDFIADSTLLVMTRSLELRVLYTEKFHPEEFIFDQSRRITAIQEGRLGEQNQEEEEIMKAEIAEEIHIDRIKLSLAGVKYQQTFKIANGIAAYLTENSMMRFHHISWIDSLQEYKKQVDGAWINVFARALEFYRGKIIGYRGIQENEEVRENVMKAELKLLIKEFMQEEIEKQNSISTRMESNSAKIIPSDSQLNSSKDSHEEIKEHLIQLQSVEDEKTHNYKTLVRIAIEFCVELQDCYFLFYELFLFFQEEKLEDLFVSELEPFIMAGKFMEWDIPNDILQNHLINYYREQEKPENLERIIINLNFRQCPQSVILELVHYAEQNSLSTALLFLYTQLFERKDVNTYKSQLLYQNTSCIRVLFSLCELYKKAEKQGSYEDIENMAFMQPNAPERFQIQRSKVYLGYKILWVIKQFINGKKFPQGHIREQKWRIYVHDIVQFISNPQILEILMNIDSEVLFQIISVLFYEGKPYNYLKQGLSAEQMNRSNSDTSLDQENFSREIVSHNSIINGLRQVCSNSPNMQIKLQYLFFVATIAVNSDIKQDTSFYFSIVKDLLKEHLKFLQYNDHAMKRTFSKKKMYRDMSRQFNIKAPDEVKHLIKSENDLITLFAKCEPMSDDQIQELLLLAKDTKFKQVRVYLLEKKEDYIQCLQLFLDGMKDNEEWSQKYFTERAFQWIREKLQVLESKSENSSKMKNLYEQFKREVLDNIKQMVLLNVNESISLIDEKFGAIHKEVIDQLKKNQNEQLIYLENLLQIKEEYIQNTIKEYSLSQKNPIEAQKYLELLKLHLKLCCQYKKDSVMQIVERICLQSYYPTEACLKICYEHHQIEACALLNKKLGKYFESIQLYLQALKEKVDLHKIKNELKFGTLYNINLQFPIINDIQSPHLTVFDKYLKIVAKICKKNHSDVDIGKEEIIWYLVLDTLFEFKNNEEFRKQKFYTMFFKKRIAILSKNLLNFISFKTFLKHILEANKAIKYKDIYDLINDVFFDLKNLKLVLENANRVIYLTNCQLFRAFQVGSTFGVLFRSLKCLHCKKYLDLTMDDTKEFLEDEDNIEDDFYFDPYNEHIRVFLCGHTFHVPCLQKICEMQEDETEEVKKQELERLKCPFCHSKDFEIENESGSPVRPRGRGGQKVNKQESAKSSGNPSQNNESKAKQNEDEIEKPQSKRKVQQIVKSHTLVQRHGNKLRKLMDNFDTQIEIEAMTIKNFKKH